jgi:hypothetical protein
MLKKNNFFLGLLIGLVLPAAIYGILYLTGKYVPQGSVWARPFETSKMVLFSLVLNVIPFRMYVVSYKCDKTGRGILFITFILVLAYFVIKRYL